MAVSTKFVWAAAICLTIALIYIGIVVPILIKEDIVNDIYTNNPLYLNTYQTWGQVPGTRDSSLTRTFYLYNVTNASTLFTSPISYFEEIRTLPYSQSFTYQNLKYIPNTNESTRFYKQFEHTYSGNEADLQNLVLTVPDIGAAKAQYIAGTLDDTSLVYSSLLSINQTFFNNTIPLLVVQAATPVFDFTQENVYSLLFDIWAPQISGPIRDQMWNDPFYGLANMESRAFWFSIILQYQSLGNGMYTNVNPNDQNIQFLANYFNLPYATVAPLLNYTSLLSQLAFAGTNNLCLALGRPSPYCSFTTFFDAQFITGTLANITCEGVNPANNLQGLNASLFYSPEFYQVNNTPGPLFSQFNAEYLFFAKATMPIDVSIFSFDIIQAALDDDLSELVDIFPSEMSSDTLDFVVQYIDFVLNNITFFGQGDNAATREARTASLAVTQGMLNLIDQMADDLLYNTTAIIALKNLTGFDCSTFVNSIDPNVSSTVCGNDNYNFATESSLAPWVQAYIEGQYGQAYTNIQNVLGLSLNDIQGILASTSAIGTAISGALANYSTALGCEGTCNGYQLAIWQWANSAVLQNLTQAGYLTLTGSSMSNLFPADYCGSPEYNFVTNSTLPAIFTQELPSYGAHSLLNQYTVMGFIINYKSQNYAANQNNLGLDQTQQASMNQYIAYIYSNYYYGLGSCDFTTKISAFDLIWGFNEQRVSQIQSSDLYGGQILYSPMIQLAGPQSNMNNFNSTPANMINTGGNNLTQLRQMTSYLGNYTICLPQTLAATGEPTCETPYLNTDDFITGTDGFGFSPLLEPSDNLTVFDMEVIREIDYIFNSDILVGSDYMELYNYTLDGSAMDASDTFNVQQSGYFNLSTVIQLPIVASLPYYKSVAAEDVVGVQINGSSPVTYTSTVTTNYYLVERLTGVTVNYTRNYLYSLEFTNPFGSNNESYIVPILAIMETYSTPAATVSSELSGYYQDMKTGNYIRLGGIILGGLIFFSVIVWYILERKKGGSRQSSQIRKESELGDSNISQVIHAGVIKEEEEDIDILE